MNLNYLSGKPFYLSSEETAWVSKTMEGMTVREKCGQLFVILGNACSDEERAELISDLGAGGILFRPAPSETVRRQYDEADSLAKIPLLRAANLEEGGAGVSSGA